jgi:serine/threonine protein kinase
MLWAGLNHVHIVQFLGAVCHGKNVHLVSEMCLCSLKQALYEHDYKFDVTETIQLLQGATAGLEYIHSKRILHFDLKPGNILIGLNGKAVFNWFWIIQG